MVLSNVNVAKTSGNGSSTVITKIHNMAWLKQATVQKNSGRCEQRERRMFGPLANMKDDEQMAPQKKNKRRSNKSKKSDTAKNIEITCKSNDAERRLNGRKVEELVTRDSQLSIAHGQSGVGKSVWRADKNVAESFFPNAAETARNVQLSEAEQMKLAVVASLQTAFLEKCAIDLPNDDKAEAAQEWDDDNIWDGVHKNLPSPNSEETIENYDANNNSGSNKSRTSSVAKKKSDGKVVSRKKPISTEKESQSGAGTSDAVPDDEPLTPVTVPKYIDQYGRFEGYTEKHLFMGKGGRTKEKEYQKQQQRQQQQKHEAAANGSNQKQRQDAGSQDSHRPGNAHVPGDDSRNDNRRGGNGYHDRQHYSVSSQNSYRSRNPYGAEDYSRNDHQQRRFSKQAKPDFGYRYPQPNAPYDPAKNSFKYIRESNDRHHDSRDRENSQKSAEHNNRSDNDTNRDGEKNIFPLVSTKVDRLSSVATKPKDSAEESANAVDRTVVETPKEAPIKTKPEICRKETTELPKDVIPKVHLSDFNSRFNLLQEQATPARSSNSCLNGPTSAHSEIVEASRQKNETHVDQARFTIPPPGFRCLEQTQHSSSSVAYVLPVDSSLGSNARGVPVESSRTSSTYGLPAESSRTSSAYGLPAEPSRTSSAYNLPAESSRTSSTYGLPAESSRTSSTYGLPAESSRTSSTYGLPAESSRTSSTHGLPAESSRTSSTYGLPAESSRTSSTHGLPAEPSRTSSAYNLPAEPSRTSSAYGSPESPSETFSDIVDMDEVYARVKMYDPMLYNLLLKKRQQESSRRNYDTQVQAAYSKVPENRNEAPINPSIHPDSQTLESYDFPAEQRHQTGTLNPNAERYVPLSEQASFSQNQQDPTSCYSVPPNYDPRPMTVYCPFVAPLQDAPRRDRSGWIASGSANPFYDTAQTSQHRVPSSSIDPAPTAILGRQNYLVSEQNYPYKNAQRPMNLQPLNDDYHRCRPSGFGNVPPDTQRQMPYRALFPQSGVAPSHFCSLPCAAMYGSQGQTARSECVNCAQLADPFRRFADIVAMIRSGASRDNRDVRMENDEELRAFAQQGCIDNEPNSIDQREHRFVQPIIRQSPFFENLPFPNKGRGKARRKNN